MADDSSTSATGEVLIGAEAIEEHLAEIGFPDEDAYYCRKSKRWPIDKYGKYLISTKSLLNRQAGKYCGG